MVHELPRRVFVSVEDTGVSISDYLFPGEGLEECASNVKVSGIIICTLFRILSFFPSVLPLKMN